MEPQSNASIPLSARASHPPWALLQGIVLKLRYNRAGHLFEFPIMLSPLLDWNVLAGGGWLMWGHSACWQACNCQDGN